MKKLYRVEEVAEILGITAKGVYKLTLEKKIKFQKPNGKTIYFTEENINEYVFGKEAVNA